MSVHKKELSHHQDNKLLIEAITTRMEQVMNSKLDALCQEVKQWRAQNRTPRGSKEPSKTPKDKERPHPWRPHETPIDRGRAPSKTSRAKEEPHLWRSHETPIGRSRDQSAPTRDKTKHEKPHLRSSREMPDWRSKEQSKSSRYGAEHVFNYGDQRSLQQTRPLQNQMETQKNDEDFDKQILKAFKAVENSHKKRTTTRPSSEVVTKNQEPSCSKKEPIFHKLKTDQPLLTCKGMNETSSSSMCADEIFMCHGREEDANTKPMVLEENAENMVSNSLLNSEHETPLADGEMENRTPCEVKSVISSSQADFVLESESICAELICLEPVQPSRVECVLQVHEENPPERTQRSLPLINDLETTCSPVPEPTFHSSIPKTFLYDIQKHCKEIGVNNTLPNLFVLVTPDEEKQFGLENVKEFCVSGLVFDQMIQSFETLRHEELSRQKDFLFNEVCDANCALSGNLFRKTFEKELIGNNTDFVIGERFSKIEHFTSLSRTELHNSKSSRENHANLSCEDFWTLKLTRAESILKKNVFESISKLEQCCAWYERVLPEYKSDCALKKWWSCLSINLKNHFIHDPTDMICLSMSKGPNAGSRTALKRKRRTQKREEDKRFKPPDLDQDTHQNATLFMMIKEAPPDNTHKPTPSLNRMGDGSDLRTNPFQVGGDDMILGSKLEPNIEPEENKLTPKEQEATYKWNNADLMLRIDGPFKITRRINNNAYQLDLQGKYNVSSSFNVSDLIPFDADDADLRTNPFQVGGDDMILDDTKEMDDNMTLGSNHEPNIEPEEDKLTPKEKEATDIWSVPVGPLTRSRTNKLKEIISGLLKSTSHSEAIPHVLTLIQFQEIQ